MVIPNNHGFSYKKWSFWGVLGVPLFKEARISPQKSMVGRFISSWGSACFQGRKCSSGVYKSSMKTHIARKSAKVEDVFPRWKWEVSIAMFSFWGCRPHNMYNAESSNGWKIIHGPLLGPSLPLLRDYVDFREWSYYFAEVLWLGLYFV